VSEIFRDFLSDSEIIDSVATSTAYSGEGTAQAKALLLFTTSTQQTWLIATTARLYCVVDDRRLPTPQMRWAMPLSEARTGPIVTREAAERYRNQAGLLNIGKRLNWIYTKRLFLDRDVVDAVRELIA
jgi:hypothetical protein